MGLSVGSYNATLTINEFKGVMQYDENESINTDMRYAADAQNIDTRDGNLLPIVEKVVVSNIDTDLSLASSLRVISIAKYSLEDSVTITNNSVSVTLGPEVVVALCYDTNISATNNRKLIVGDPFHGFVVLDETHAPSSKLPAYTNMNYKSFGMEFVQYEYLDSLESRHKGLIIASYDGLYGLDDAFMADRLLQSFATRHIALYGERIFATGRTSYPDTIYYSTPYDANNWQANVAIPEDGAGEIRLPTWDGDKYSAIVPFGNTLILFSENHIWRLTGLTPSEFSFQEQIGPGTLYPQTIVSYRGCLYYLTDKGVYVYDGSESRPFQTQALRTVWRDLLRKPGRNNTELDIVSGFIYDDKYVLSFPKASNASFYTDYDVVYDFREGGWRYYEKLVKGDARFVMLEGIPHTIGSGNATNGEPIKLMRWYGSIENVPAGETTNRPTTLRGFTWVTPWTDMGCKDVLKSQFEVRFWIQTHVNTTSTSPMTGTEKLKLEITIETERGSKTREMLFDRDVDKEIKLRFHITGRKARMTIKVRNGAGGETMHAWCKIMGGMQINADTATE